MPGSPATDRDHRLPIKPCRIRATPGAPARSAAATHSHSAATPTINNTALAGTDGLRSRLLSGLIGRDLSDSEADSAGSIPVTHSILKAQVSVPFTGQAGMALPVIPCPSVPDLAPSCHDR
jgi:hypothetical protein